MNTYPEWLVGKPELNPLSFVYQNHSMDNSWIFNSHTLPDGWTCIGYTDSMKVTFRPRPGLAVMFEDDTGEQFWTHFSE